MTFIKKNLPFCVVIALCLFAFIGGALLAFSSAGKVEKAQLSLSTSESRLQALLRSTPAPIESNLAIAEQNLSNLQSAMAEIRTDLQRGAAMKTSSDGVSVIAGIQAYIAKLNKAADSYVNEDGIATLVAIPDGFAYGFEQYSKQARPPEDPAKAAVLDKQRQILSYLIRELIAAGPHSVDKVERKIFEIPDQDGFVIDPAISSRVPGAIDTTAFRLTFSGYTDALRDFLNSLARFELPIVVRSISVMRPSGSETVVANSTNNDARNLFALFGDGESTAEETASEWPKTVVEENISKFTVVLEFIEVVLPDSQNLDGQDGQDGQVSKENQVVSNPA